MAGCGDETTAPDPTSPPTADPPRPATITVSPSTASLDAIGANVPLNAAVTDQNGNAMGQAPVTWSSSAPDVAAVSSTGLVTAVANGSATVTATSGSAEGVAEVVVEQAAAAIAVDRFAHDYYTTSELVELAEDTIQLWNLLTLGATVRDREGHEMIQPIEWQLLDSIAYPNPGGLITNVEAWAPRSYEGSRVFLNTGNARPDDPIWARLVATTVRASDSVPLADTVVVLVLADLGFIEGRRRSLDLPVHVDVGGTVQIDLHGWYESPRGLPVTYEVGVTSTPGQPPGPEDVAEIEVREGGLLTVTGLADGVAGLVFAVRTELEYVGSYWPGALYVGDIRCPATGVPRASDDAPFRVELDYADELPPCVRSVIDGAVGWWERALADNNLSDSESCGVAAGTLAVSVETRFQELGGPLAAAAPLCSDEITREGWMELSEQMFLGQKKDPRFHSPNIGLMYETVRHEIGHILGMAAGTAAWDELVQDNAFLGRNAVTAFLDLGGQGSGVPLEDDGYRSHWSEAELGGELMSPRIGVSERPPLSAITLGALADLGWVVDMSVAEDYTVGAAHARVYADGADVDDNCLIDIHGSTPTPAAGPARLWELPFPPSQECASRPVNWRSWRR
ncbi:MAG: Ig-like domain-containing protein [Gammaproteobacteria bacterium]|nr:Ig-like domain-containing protein [Gammaproteobacteria bacterium]